MSANFIIPMTGTLLELNRVPDQNFSQKLLGEGFAVKLAGDRVVSPFDGVVIAAFPTGHAFIVRRDDGVEVLIHIGLNSADKPQAFKNPVAKYSKVKQGDVLVYVDTEILARDGETMLISPIVFSNPSIKLLLYKADQRVEAGERQAVGFA